ncbi:MAG TPA: TldD/PmbA family protein [Bacteroidales bacterium]
MKKTKFIKSFILSVLLFQGYFSVQAQDKLINILDEEIQREMKWLKTQETPAYYLAYRVDEITTYSVTTSLGALTDTSTSTVRILTISLRVGTPKLDNYHDSHPRFSIIELPSSEEPLAVKQVLWDATKNDYQTAVSNLSNIKANLSVTVEEEDKSPDFSEEQPNVYIEPSLKPEDIKFNTQEWIDRLKKYSAAFLRDSDIFKGSSYISYQITRKYFVSSSGDKIAQNSTATNLGFNGTIKAKDGMEMPLVKTYFAFKPEGLPSDESISNDVNNLVNDLVALKKAPVADPYTGPALLSGRAAGVFFHEIFGHRIEGQRMKNETDAQTFKKKVNEQVLLPTLDVYSDPEQTKFGNQDLTGYYIYDDQGEKGQKVSIVENGILKNFLMSRTPINGFLKSNGHGRAMYGMQPASRQSNLIVETTDTKTEDEMKKELIRLAREQNKPYGYLFDEVVGGFTTTGRYSPNAFNVTPTMVYRIYTDGRPDELVRGVNLIGTPLSMFSQIVQAGGKTEVFNGVCGAESGSVPVSAVSPMLLVKQIETQKKAKSFERSIILPRPDEEK